MGLPSRNYTYRVKDFGEFSENPFLESISIRVTPKSNIFLQKNKGVIDLSTGELEDESLLMGRRKLVDGEEFVKIFINEIRAIFDLSRVAQKVFGYMLTKVGYSDQIIFNTEECQKHTGYKSRPPIFVGIGELLKEEFIAKTKNQFVYWINPKVFYKGDRLVTIREYRKAKRDKIAAPNQLHMFNKQVEGVEKLTKRIES